MAKRPVPCATETLTTDRMVTTEDGWKRNNSNKINGLRKKPDKKTVEMDGESL